MVSQEIDELQWDKLLVMLKRKCGKRNPTVKQMEWAMDKLDLPEEVEIDYDEVVLDLSCFELDVEQEQIRSIERKYRKLAKQARALESIEEQNNDLHGGFENDKNCWRKENEALVARVDQIVSG